MQQCNICCKWVDFYEFGNINTFLHNMCTNSQFTNFGLPSSHLLSRTVQYNLFLLLGLRSHYFTVTDNNYIRNAYDVRCVVYIKIISGLKLYIKNEQNEYKW